MRAGWLTSSPFLANELASRASDRHPQDPARGRRHAGEQVVRQLLRHLPGCRGHPEGRRQANRLHTGQAPRPLHPPVPRSQPRRHRWATFLPCCKERHRRRQDGRLHKQPTRERSLALQESAGTSRLRRREPPPLVRPPRRRRLARRPRDPQLLGLCQAFRPCRPHVRGRQVVELAGASRHGLWLVGGLLGPRGSHELQDVHRKGPRRVRADPDSATLCLDGSNVPAHEGGRELAILRRARNPTRLRQCSGDLCSEGTERRDPRHLEPAAGLPDGPSGRPAGEHPNRLEVLRGGQGRGACECHLDSAEWS